MFYLICCAGETAAISVSLGYASPELIVARNGGAKTVVADPAVDVWALGVTSIELLTGQSTFSRDSEKSLEEQVCSASFL